MYIYVHIQPPPYWPNRLLRFLWSRFSQKNQVSRLCKTLHALPAYPAIVALFIQNRQVSTKKGSRAKAIELVYRTLFNTLFY